MLNHATVPAYTARPLLPRELPVLLDLTWSPVLQVSEHHHARPISATPASDDAIII